MTFFAEIKKSLGEMAGVQIQYSVIDGAGGYFQNVRRIAEFSPQKIVVLGKKGKLCITGEELSLGKYCLGDVFVRGKIVSVSQIDE